MHDPNSVMSIESLTLLVEQNGTVFGVPIGLNNDNPPPDLSEYATKEYVRNAIAAIEMPSIIGDCFLAVVVDDGPLLTVAPCPLPPGIGNIDNVWPLKPCAIGDLVRVHKQYGFCYAIPEDDSVTTPPNDEPDCEIDVLLAQEDDTNSIICDHNNSLLGIDDEHKNHYRYFGTRSAFLRLTGTNCKIKMSLYEEASNPELPGVIYHWGQYWIKMDYPWENLFDSGPHNRDWITDVVYNITITFKKVPSPTLFSFESSYFGTRTVHTPVFDFGAPKYFMAVADVYSLDGHYVKTVNSQPFYYEPSSTVPCPYNKD